MWEFVRCAAAIALAVIPLAAFADQPRSVNAEVDARIATLIQQLGSDEFTERERAQEELMNIGLAAFDPLMEAQKNKDLEIAFRAKNLVRRLRIAWVLESDPLEVKRILKNYSEQPHSERHARLVRLSKLENGAGVAPLCRVARFDTNKSLSKTAALLIMQQTQPANKPERDQLSQMILSQTGASDRAGPEWLRTYAQFLRDPESTLQKWSELTDDEFAALNETRKLPDPILVRDLLRWRAGMLSELGHRDEAISVMRQTIDLLDGTPDELLNAVDWLLDRQAWSVVEELADRFAGSFDRDPILLYRLAESKLGEKDLDAAAKLADRALNIFDASATEQHLLLGVRLQSRGLFDWAENEYRTVFKGVPVGSIYDFRTRIQLSEMLHDQEREADAGDALKVAMDAVDKEPAVAAVLKDQLGRDPGAVRSRMHFFYGLQRVADGKLAEARKEYEAGLEGDPTDADLLIGMHRLPNADEAWRTKTKAAIQSAAKLFSDQKKEIETQIEAAPSEPMRDYYRNQLAIVCNQYAWLVSNTIGDYKDALKASQTSLEMRPDSAGYLDTLGRAHYAVGDLDSAIKHQSRAAELEPHSLAIQRQLKFFQAEKAKQPAPADSDAQ